MTGQDQGYALLRDDWTEIDGLLTNLLLDRFELIRNGEKVELTQEERNAITRFKRARAHQGVKA